MLPLKQDLTLSVKTYNAGITLKKSSGFYKRGILLAETNRNINSQKRVLLNFVKPLISVDLPLIKNVLTSLAKMCFGTIRINSSSVSSRWSISNESLWIRHNSVNNLKLRNGGHYENS